MNLPNDIKQLVEQKYNNEHLINGQRGAALFTFQIISNLSGILDYSKLSDIAKEIYPIVKKKADKMYQEAGWDNTEIATGWGDLCDMLDNTTEFCTEMIRLSLNNQTI
jgi:hypothetical protein